MMNELERKVFENARLSGENRKLKHRAGEMEAMIITLLEELGGHVDTSHNELTVKALRMIGLNDAEIKLYFRGELALLTQGGE
jgi:hypothetical protein